MSKVSETIVSHVLVFPNDSNGIGNMFGGRIMEIMDSCAAIGVSPDPGWQTILCGVLGEAHR